MNNKIYEDIWLSFNQNNLKQINLRFATKQSELIFSEIEEYFNSKSNYKLIHLSSISSDDEHYLKEKAILFQCLVENFKKTITKSKAKLSFDDREFQLQGIEDKFIYAICPFSGEIIKSNKSVVVTRDVIFYRFSSREIFYVITTNLGSGFKKGAIYFPNNELIIQWDENTWGFNKGHLIQFKALLVSNFNEFNYYFSDDTQQRKIAVIIGCSHFAHEILNELSGIYRIYRKGSLNKIDKFFITAESFGKINQIFPEIPVDKIKYFNGGRNIPSKTEQEFVRSEMVQEIVRSEMLKEIVSNEYLVINVGDCFIKDELVDRIYKVAVKNCSAEVIDKIKVAKKKHFPLLWISIRAGYRSWTNQVEGISQIINSLAKDFPKLGVVFDGFSLSADYFGDRPLQPNNFVLETIKRENEIASQIINNLSNLEMGVFNTIGCSIWESNVWANTIDLYLTNHGTTQHKVGWLANKPGIVHSNKTILKRNNQWVANLRESGINPIYISDIHVKDSDVEFLQRTKDEFRDDLNNYDIDWRVLYKEIWKLSKLIEKRRNLIGKFLNFFNQSQKNNKKMLKFSKEILKFKLKCVLNYD